VSVHLIDLPTWQSRDVVRAVVETPRGSTAKIKYDPDLEAFVFQRPLAHGISYPYDWGSSRGRWQRMAIRWME
jgi:inorganic pyrophosphatase